MELVDVIRYFGPDQYATAIATGLLFGLLALGVTAGNDRKRYKLLAIGAGAIVVACAIAVVIAGASLSDGFGFLAVVLPVMMPLLVAFYAGWLLPAQRWRNRAVIVVVAVATIAFFPYDTVVQVTEFVANG